MIKSLCFILIAAAAYSQSSTKVTIVPKQDDSATGVIELREKYANGTNKVTIQAPDELPASYTIKYPRVAPSANQCAVYNGSTFTWVQCNGDLNPDDYDWSQATGGTVVVGANTKTLTPCPAGLAGTDTHHAMRVKNGTGTAETVVITGGTCTSGASTGTVIFTAANTHSGAYTLSSASDGLQEAINLAATGGKRVTIPLGVTTLDEAAPGETATVYIQGPITVTGVDNSINGGSELSIASNNFALSVGLGSGGSYPVNLSNFVIHGDNMTTGGGIQFTATSTHNCYSVVQDMQLYTLPTGIDFEKGCAAQIHRNLFYGYTDIGLRVRNTYDTDVGDHAITSNNFLVIGAGGIGTTAISWESGGGSKIIGNKFNTQGAGIDMAMTGPTIIAIISDNSFDNQTEYSFRARGTTGFLGITLTGNVVTGAGGVSYTAFDIGHDTTDDISNVTIVGNSMQAVGTAIKIGDVQNVMIDSNVIGIFTTGIDLKAAAVGVTLGKNNFYTVTTPITFAALASIKPTSPGLSTGYFGFAASNTNTKSIHEFLPPASGAVNNAVIFGTSGTGANSQRGITWDNSGRMAFVRLNSNRTTSETDDFVIGSDGIMVTNFGLGVLRSPGNGNSFDVDGMARATKWNTKDICLDGSGAAACGSAAAGFVVVDAGATTVVVSSTAVTANSQILLTMDISAAAQLGVTCNTTYANTYVSARTASTSFTITASAAPVTNPLCLSFLIVN